VLVKAAGAAPSALGGGVALHVEVIGPTSGGKSTLTRAIEQACRQRGIDATDGDDLVLRQVALHWVRGEFVRRRLVDVPALMACLLGWGVHRELRALALEASRRSPGGWTRKLNTARNALRKIGIFEIVRRRRREGQLVLVDNEGVLQAVHNLFVHVSAETNARAVAAFLRLAPLPDAVVYVRADERVLVARTLARGHRRVPACSPDAAAGFVSRAVRVFETLACEPAIRRRLVLVGSDRSVQLAEEAGGDPRLCALAELVRAGVDLVRARFGAEAEDHA
jgi:thymidylate kinase